MAVADTSKKPAVDSILRKFFSAETDMGTETEVKPKMDPRRNGAYRNHKYTIGNAA